MKSWRFYFWNQVIHCMLLRILFSILMFIGTPCISSIENYFLHVYLQMEDYLSEKQQFKPLRLLLQKHVIHPKPYYNTSQLILSKPCKPFNWLESSKTSEIPPKPLGSFQNHRILQKPWDSSKTLWFVQTTRIPPNSEIPSKKIGIP